MKAKTINLATFHIKTPADGGDYHLSLGQTEITAKTLKYGVIKLFNKAGIIPGGTRGVEYQLIDIIKGCPASYQQKLLLNILDLNNSLPAHHFNHHQNALDKQEIIFTPPIKVPYRRHGQTSICDDIINAAIAKGGSYRSISKNLLHQGLIISHMSIKRRIEER